MKNFCRWVLLIGFLAAFSNAIATWKEVRFCLVSGNRVLVWDSNRMFVLSKSVIWMAAPADERSFGEWLARLGHGSDAEEFMAKVQSEPKRRVADVIEFNLDLPDSQLAPAGEIGATGQIAFVRVHTRWIPDEPSLTVIDAALATAGVGSDALMKRLAVGTSAHDPNAWAGLFTKLRERKELLVPLPDQRSTKVVLAISCTIPPALPIRNGQPPSGSGSTIGTNPQQERRDSAWFGYSLFAAAFFGAGWFAQRILGRWRGRKDNNDRGPEGKWAEKFGIGPKGGEEPHPSLEHAWNRMTATEAKVLEWFRMQSERFGYQSREGDEAAFENITRRYIKFPQLEDQVRRLEADVVALGHFREYAEQREAFEKQLRTAQESSQWSKTELNKARDDLQTLRDRNAALQREVETTKNDIKGKEDLLADQEEALRNYEASIEAANSQIAQVIESLKL